MTSPAGKSRSASGRPLRRAFTFIEILATMSLLAIVLPSVMAGISLSLSAAGLARQKAQASSLGYGKLTELVTLGQWQQQALTGDFGKDYPEYTWTAQVSDWDGSVLKQLDVTVAWQHRGSQHTAVFSTLVNTSINTGMVASTGVPQ